MDNKYTTAFEEQDTFSSGRDDCSSVDCELGDVSNSDKLTHSYDDVDMLAEK
jgi:hypothetical protein